MSETTWKKSPQYQRIIEILKDYWLEEPDELKVRVQMDFIKANGEKQSKCICWENPNYTRPRSLEIVALSDMDDAYFKRKEAEFWDISNYRRK